MWLSRHTRQHRPLSSQASNDHCRFAETAPFPILNHHHSHPTRLSPQSHGAQHTHLHPLPKPITKQSPPHSILPADPYHPRPNSNSNSTANPPPNLKHNHLEPIISLSPPQPPTTQQTLNLQPALESTTATMSEAYERERQNNARLDELSSKVSALRGVTIDIYRDADDHTVIGSTVRVPPPPPISISSRGWQTLTSWHATVRNLFLHGHAAQGLGVAAGAHGVVGQPGGGAEAGGHDCGGVYSVVLSAQVDLLSVRGGRMVCVGDGIIWGGVVERVVGKPRCELCCVCTNKPCRRFMDRGRGEGEGRKRVGHSTGVYRRLSQTSLHWIGIRERWEGVAINFIEHTHWVILNYSKV